MYYLDLEEQSHYRHQLDHAEQPYRNIMIDEVEIDFQHIIQRSSMEEYEAWKEILRNFTIKLQSKDTLLVKKSYTYERACYAQRGELSSGHYVFAMSNVFNQMAQMLEMQEPGLQNSNRPSQ